MGSINLDNTGSGSDITLSSDGTSLLLDGTAIGGGGDVVDDTSPQLGGALQLNGNNIQANDSTGVTQNRIELGTSQDLKLYHDGSNSRIEKSGDGKLIVSSGANNNIDINAGTGGNTIELMASTGQVRLYYGGSNKLQTESTGITVAGTILGVDDITTSAASGNPTLNFGDGTGNFGNCTINFNSGATGVSGHIKHVSGGGFEIKTNTGGNYIKLQTYDGAHYTPLSVDGNVVTISSAYNLPSSDGTSGQVLTTDGAGTLSFATASGGGSPDLYADNDVSATAPSATGNNTVAIGDGATATNTGSMSFGVGADATGSGTVAIGRLAQATGYQSHAFGLQASSSGAYSTAIGRGNGYISQATGNGSTSIGASYCSGTDALAAIQSTNSSSYGATAANTLAIGYLAKANTADSVAIGSGSVASGSTSVAIGTNHYGGATASGAASVCIGQNYALSNPSASAAGSISLGDGSGTNSTAPSSMAVLGAKTNVKGQYAYAGGESGGTAQTSTYVLKRATTDATETTLVTDRIIDTNSTPGSYNQIFVQPYGATAFSGLIIAREDDTDGDDYAAWQIKGAAIKTGAAVGDMSLGQAIIDKIYSSTGASAWDCAIAADTTYGVIKITVTGAASTNIRWVATVNTSEVKNQ